MPKRTEVSIESKSFSLIPGDAIQTAAIVRNLGNTISQFNFMIDGLDSNWYSLPVSSTTLFPNDNEKLIINFHPPRKDGVKAGFYNFRLIVAAQENPDEKEIVELTLEVKAVPELEVEITPKRITGRRGLYKIIASNPGDKDTTVQLQCLYPKGKLRCKLQPSQFTVSGSGHSESTLEARLRWWAFLGKEKEFDFQVLATQPDVDKVKTASGQLVRVSKRIRFPRIPLPRVKPLRRRQPPTITRFEATTMDKRKFNLAWSVEQAVKVKLDDEEIRPHGECKVSPTEAKSYILTASNKYGSIHQIVDVDPLPVPKERYSDRVMALVSPNMLSVVAGGEPVEAVVEIQNLGRTVDKFSVEIEGIAESWYSISASIVALMPQDKDQVEVSFHPPKTQGVRADVYPFAVTIRSQSIRDECTSVMGQLEVLPSVEFNVTVAPYRTVCRRKCTFQAHIENRDVSDAELFLDASDLEDGVRFRINNDSPVVAAWQTIEVPMIARPTRASIIGERKRYDITVTGRTADGYTQFARCQMDHKPFLSSWRPIFRIMRYLIIFGAIGYIVYYILHMGGGWDSFLNNPQRWLDGTIRHIRGWFY